ncbi:T9SS type A sorting domain-containing protein [Spirosoma koreense]
MTYEKAGHYIEQATATIEATNKVNALTNVEYRAGRSVTMLPGFEARTGSIFKAAIMATSIDEEGSAKLQLVAFPNPFERSTTIEYYLPTNGKVNVWVTDLQGRIVGQLVTAENQSAGTHRIEWRPTDSNPGIYMPTVELNQQKIISRIVKK